MIHPCAYFLRVYHKIVDMPRVFVVYRASISFCPTFLSLQIALLVLPIISFDIKTMSATIIAASAGAIMWHILQVGVRESHYLGNKPPESLFRKQAS